MNFFFKKPEKNVKGNEYSLLHDILFALRFAGMMVNAQGSPKAGHKPLYELQLATARLTFGTLCAFVNEPDKYQNLQNDGNLDKALNSLEITIEEISECKYSIKEISQAVDVLEATKDVNKKLDGEWIYLNQKLLS